MAIQQAGSFFTKIAQKSLEETLKLQMVTDWERAKAYTKEYLDVMPADKYAFKAGDSVRSFAEQMLHLALSDAGLVFNATGAPFPFAPPYFEKWSTAKSKDSVMYYVNTNYDFAINATKTMDASKLTEVMTRDLPGGTRSATRLA